MLTKLRSKAACLALALASTALFVVPSVQASPVTYNFTVTPTSGPLSGTSSSTGSFSYDTSSIIPGGYNNNLGLLTALTFTFNGTAYNAGSANTGYLGFDSAGNLASFVIGNHCGFEGGVGQPENCSAEGGTNQWFTYPASQANAFSEAFLYDTPGFNDFGGGDVTFSLAAASPVSSVPEPGVLGMFGFGALLLGVFVSRRRRTC